MGFFEDFGTGFTKPFEYAYDKILKVDKVVDHVIDAAGNVAQGVGGLTGGIADLLSGNSNFLLYIGLGIAGVVIVPILLQKYL